VAVVPWLADVTDAARLGQIFRAELPDVVFHAAAREHVPTLEWNPAEAVGGNVLGTCNVADLAHECGAAEFVLTSTTKAANPTSVMGASRRVAELYVQGLAQRSRTRFVAVRLGNVLGSAGSVVPILQEQIARGGPVLVSHPETRRYFLTTPEACQLVLQAASMGQGGEVFALDVGEPVKVVDLARELILLWGLQPGKDVKIRFTGVRPGEKLCEEPAPSGEAPGKTRHPRVFFVRPNAGSWEWVSRQVEELRELAGGESCSIRAKFSQIVPEYRDEARASARLAAEVRLDAGHAGPPAAPHETGVPTQG
jgi:FlaA1/EpsC-like NDP-sugar epimerase